MGGEHFPHLLCHSPLICFSICPEGNTFRTEVSLACIAHLSLPSPVKLPTKGPAVIGWVYGEATHPFGSGLKPPTPLIRATKQVVSWVMAFGHYGCGLHWNCYPVSHSKRTR
ncbi:hypothetical protein KIL84_019706 [Mauremys mutica]|uniref:Uncharacterized protein n=1 Tax=Mauremys mutica TaxID=74926 RepID=A0A9D4B3K1_9SAUR|nr:hypothetical protein KIL84_019706 [Mauremys mutica]